MNYREDRETAVQWAKAIVKRADWVILDTETTGLDDAEICQIGIIDSQKSVLLDTYIKPYRPITKRATAIHGITDKTVENSPRFKEVYPKLREILKDKLTLIYNKNFDLEIIQNCRQIDDLEAFSINAQCVMLPYSNFVGDWNDYWGNYRWQKLPGGDHTALGDCFATHKILLEMSNASPLPEELEDCIPY